MGMTARLQPLNLQDNALMDHVYGLVIKAYPRLRLQLERVRAELAPDIFGPRALYLGVYEDDELVAFNAFLPHRLKMGTDDLPVYQSSYSATHPQHQGRGHFTALQEEAASLLATQAVLIVGFPNAESFPIFTGRLGFGHLPQHYSFRFRVPLPAVQLQQASLEVPIAAAQEDMLIYKRRKYGKTLHDHHGANRLWAVPKRVTRLGLPIQYCAVGDVVVQNHATLWAELQQLAQGMGKSWVRAEYLPGHPLHRLLPSSRQKAVATPFIWRSLQGDSFRGQDFALMEGLRDSF